MYTRSRSIQVSPHTHTHMFASCHIDSIYKMLCSYIYIYIALVWHLLFFFISFIWNHSHIQWRSMYSAILSKDLQFGLEAQCLHQHLNFLRYAIFLTFFPVRRVSAWLLAFHNQNFSNVSLSFLLWLIGSMSRIKIIFYFDLDTFGLRCLMLDNMDF